MTPSDAMLFLSRRCSSVMLSSTMDWKSCGACVSHDHTRWTSSHDVIITWQTSHVPSSRGGASVGSQRRTRSGSPDLNPRSRMNFQLPSASSTRIGVGAVDVRVDLPTLLSPWMRMLSTSSSFTLPSLEHKQDFHDNLNLS